MTVARRSQNILKKSPPLIKQYVSHQAFQAQVKRALITGAKPVLAELKMAALSLPSKGTRSPTQGPRNLRKRIANSLEIDLRGGAADPSIDIVSRKSKMGDAPFLPARTNEGRWRHPVMGNMNVWVSQTSRQGWFDVTAEKAGMGEVRDKLVSLLSFLKAKWTFK